MLSPYFRDVKGKRNPRYKTGMRIGARCKSTLYSTWQNMKTRCFNSKTSVYLRYGAKGITVCKEWLTIEGFMSWAYSSGFQEGLSIERKDPSGNYCPENCEWITIGENSRRRNLRHDYSKNKYPKTRKKRN